MTNQTTNASKECSKFQQQLPEFFDSEVSMSDQPHLKTCANCSALVRDLEYIAVQAKLLLPIHDPSPVVWQNIQSVLTKNLHNDEQKS